MNSFWCDRIPAEKAAKHPECARYPYLGPGFELSERTPGTAPFRERRRTIADQLYERITNENQSFWTT